MGLPRLRLRSQLLLVMIPVACVLVAVILAVVRYSVRTEVHSQTKRGLQGSVHAFERVQREQAVQLARTAELIAELPTLKALMTTDDAITIQDASQGFASRS